MFKNYITSKYLMFFAKAILTVIFILSIHSIISISLMHKELINKKNIFENKQILYAKIIDSENSAGKDTSSSVAIKKEKSDLFYYILGILILIAAGFILKQRYEQYLKQHDNSFH